MDAAVPFRLVTHFATLPDPRVRGRCEHRLLDVVVMALCAVIANCDDWHQVALFARERRDWFARFLDLPHGVPSHDTFERVFDRLDPAAFQKCFASWVKAIGSALAVPHIAIDGKTLRGSRRADLGALHLVSAWATDAHLTLGQVAVDAKSNEIAAIPELLQLLDLKGAFVTIDAMGCQTAIAGQIVRAEGDYLLAVKGNQDGLLEAVQDRVREALDDADGRTVESFETTEAKHGRVDQRTYVVIPTPAGLPGQEAWPQLRAIGMCVSQRIVNGTTTGEARYFIGSAALSAEAFAALARNHWRIENNLHWQLDVTFREDANRVSGRRAGENLALLRRLALGLLKRDPTKMSLAGKRLRAALSPEFLEKLLRSDNKLEKL
jgi:predicted transposase YbfD/YdcC